MLDEDGWQEKAAMTQLMMTKKYKNQIATQ
jgi:hypothetical protein